MEDILNWLIHLLSNWGYYIVFLATFLENSIFVGLVMPGETIVVIAGFFAAKGDIEPDLPNYIQLLKVMGFAGLGAFLGDTTGYLIGRFGAGKIIIKISKFFFKHKIELKVAEKYIEKHGGKTIFFGRFTSFLRAFAPFMAGMGRMPIKKFLFYDFIGAVPWAIGFSLLGFIFRESWEQIHSLLGKTSIIAIIIAVVIIVIYKKRREKQTKKKEMEGTNDV